MFHIHTPIPFSGTRRLCTSLFWSVWTLESLKKNLRRCEMLPLFVSVRNDNICHGSQINNVPGTADGHGDDVRRHYGSGNRPQKGIINSSQHAVQDTFSYPLLILVSKKLYIVKYTVQCHCIQFSIILKYSLVSEWVPKTDPGFW